MAYSTEVVRRARARLAQAKADRESENREHLQRAYNTVPRLAEIDKQLRVTMASAIGAVFSAGGDVQSAVNEAKEKNLALQAERENLVNEYFEEGFLDDSPICDVCGGSGYIGSNMCECRRELCRQEQKKELTFLNVGRETFDQFRLDYYPDRIDPKLGVNIRAVMERTLQTCRRYAYSFSEKSGNLLFSGDTGRGKTFLSACIARTVADNGYSVVYESAGHLFSKLERAKFSGDEDAREEVKKYNTDNVYVIGGGSIYEQMLPYCDTAYVTYMDYAYEADTYFPNLDNMDDWKIVEESEEQTYFNIEYYYRTYKNVK